MAQSLDSIDTDIEDINKNAENIAKTIYSVPQTFAHGEGGTAKV